MLFFDIVASDGYLSITEKVDESILFDLSLFILYLANCSANVILVLVLSVSLSSVEIARVYFNLY